MKQKANVLQHELDEIKSQIAALEAALKDKPDYGLGTGASGAARWELNRAMLQRLKARAASLEQALSQVNEATYGVCAECGSPIHPDRLAVLPDTRLCIRCARAGGQAHSASQHVALRTEPHS
jgi:DnaK suppressor protein